MATIIARLLVRHNFCFCLDAQSALTVPLHRDLPVFYDLPLSGFLCRLLRLFSFTLSFDLVFFSLLLFGGFFLRFGLGFRLFFLLCFPFLFFLFLLFLFLFRFLVYGLCLGWTIEVSTGDCQLALPRA